MKEYISRRRGSEVERGFVVADSPQHPGFDRHA